jgi:hypothetical protein
MMRRSLRSDRNVRHLPEDLQVDRTRCRGTGKVEELDRYWGHRTGWSHYLTLPWRTVMNLDSAGYYVTTFPVLLLFPLVFLAAVPVARAVAGCCGSLMGTLFMIAQWMLFANGVSGTDWGCSSAS